jgi:nucleotide-binding universal stress UspA family protein
MKRILLPTDFSNNSWNAIQYAMELYQYQICHFTLLHTYTPVVYQVEFMQANTTQFQVMDAVKETAIKRLDEIYKRIKSAYNNPKHTFSQRTSFNTLTSEIDELFQDNEMDMIVMGTKGSSGLTKVLLGSNTVHVIKRTKCPLIAVPSSFSFENLDEILFPSDYEVDFQEKHLNPIIDIATYYDARVNILNATYGYDLSEQQKNNKQKLEMHFKNITHVFHNVSNQNVTEAIANFQLKMKVNVLVMLNNKHSFFDNLFFKSNIKHIGLHLNVPFLVIPSRL